jgi:hypothetical protein
MTSRHILAFVAAVLVSVGTAFADPPATLYVTNGPGKRILAITIDPTTGVQVGSASTLVVSGSALTDLTQRSDGALFYATGDAIRRIGQDAPVATVAGAQELRFSAYNCLFYNRAGGVNSIACGNPTPAATGGRGLAFTPFGHLLAISGSTVVRIPVDALGNEGTPVTIVSTGLTTPTGLAVAAGKGSNGLERGDFVVTDGAYVRLYDGKTGALKNATYASVPVGQTINFADFDADDRLWLAAMTSNGASALPNGRVYRVDAGNAVCGVGTNCTLAAVLPQSVEQYWPAVGLALGPSSRLLTQSIAPTVPNVEQTFPFDFGGSIVEINGVVIDSCDLRVRARTAFVPDATALVNNSQYALNPYLGDEGFPTIYHIESLKAGNIVPANACFDTVDRPSVFIAALTSTEINPRVLRCESGCDEIELFGWWHTGPIDGDGEGGGRIDDFSDWLIVEKAIQPVGQQIQYCGVAPPLKTNGISVHNSGSNLTVKVQFSLPGQPCGQGFLTDPNAKFLISLAQISPVHEKKRLVNASGNSSSPAILDQGGKAYEFELSLKEEDGTNYADGTYEITISDQTPAGTRLTDLATIYFRLGKK